MTVPVTASQEARAYQAYLLDALGRDDPAEVQAAAPAGWREIVEEAGPDLRTRPAPGEWSVLECLGHAVDGEIVAAARYRWILAEDAPLLVGYDQEAWPRALRHVDADPNELLELLGALRTADVRLWLSTDDAGRARVGMHAERGPESFDLLFRMLAGHDRIHLAQARRAIEAVRSGSGSAGGSTAEAVR
ncbi:MAG TPA: DinB family protein [Candidatus Dormibacteraeota bacterium]|nr:DinB family protein [Candidatus Dormibacteraeota bacterium]